jgi:hypothetical protein
MTINVKEVLNKICNNEIFNNELLGRKEFGQRAHSHLAT